MLIWNEQIFTYAVFSKLSIISVEEAIITEFDVIFYLIVAQTFEGRQFQVMIVGQMNWQ